MRPDAPLAAWLIVGFCLGGATFLLGVLGISMWNKPDKEPSTTMYGTNAAISVVALGLSACCVLAPWLWFDLYRGLARVGLATSFPAGFVFAVVAWWQRDQLPRLVGRKPRPHQRKSKTDRELERIAGDSFCHLKTTGQVAGQPHDVQIWFAVSGRTIYLLSIYKDQAHWVKNVLKEPRVSVLVSKRRFTGSGRLLSDPDEEQRARRLLAKKYRDFEADGTLGEWAREALPVAVDIDGLTSK